MSALTRPLPSITLAEGLACYQADLLSAQLCPVPWQEHAADVTALLAFLA